MLEQRRFARHAAEDQVLKTAAHDGMEDRPLAMRHGVHLDHVPVGALAIILRELAKGTFGLSRLRQQAAFDHDLGIRWYADLVRLAAHHVERRAAERAGDLELVMTNRNNSLGGEQRCRIDADNEGDFERFALGFRFAIEMVRVPRQEKDADPAARSNPKEPPSIDAP